MVAARSISHHLVSLLVSALLSSLPPPPRKAPVVLLKCTPEHDPPHQDFPFHSFQLNTLWPWHVPGTPPSSSLGQLLLSVHVFSTGRPSCSPQQVKSVLCSFKAPFRLLVPTDITCLLPVAGILPAGHRAACCLGRSGRMGSSPARRQVRGEWAAMQAGKARQTSNEPEENADTCPRPAVSARRSPGWQQVALDGSTSPSRANSGL